MILVIALACKALWTGSFCLTRILDSFKGSHFFLLRCKGTKRIFLFKMLQHIHGWVTHPWLIFFAVQIKKMELHCSFFLASGVSKQHMVNFTYYAVCILFSYLAVLTWHCWYLSDWHEWVWLVYSSEMKIRKGVISFCFCNMVRNLSFKQIGCSWLSCRHKTRELKLTYCRQISSGLWDPMDFWPCQICFRRNPAEILLLSLRWWRWWGRLRH